jgi:uncharacterized protein (TIGR02596 family)
MRHLSNFERRAKRAFTLIEMLVVVSIIAMLMALATPALMRTMQATRLTSTGDTLYGSISEALQAANAQNVPVELRFFKYSDPEFTGSAPLFMSYQLFKIVLMTQGVGAAATMKETEVPFGSLVKFPDGIAVAVDKDLSPLLNGQGINDTKNGSPVGYSGVANATYSAVRFMSDGSCRQVTTPQAGFSQLTYANLPVSFFTITYSTGQTISVGNLPKNFYTIQIDPYTSRARTYKPGF